MEWLKKLIGPVGLILIVAGGVGYGILYSSGFLAFLPLLAGLILTVTSLFLGRRRDPSSSLSRSARYGISTGISILVFAAIVIFIQALSLRHNLRIDTTRNRRFSLSPQTEKVLRGLEKDIYFTCFFKETSEDKIVLEDLLRAYRNISPRIIYTFIDPDKDPVTARRYALKKFGTTFVETADSKEELKGLTEGDLTNSILRVISSHQKTIYFSTGHGEKGMNDPAPGEYKALREALEQENFLVRELLIIREEKIPEDCDILVIAGPRRELLKKEQNSVLDYLTRGGKGLFLLDPITETEMLSGIAAAYGIDLGRNVVVDRAGKVLAGNLLTPVINRYGQHPITEGFRQFSFFPQARSVTALAEIPRDVSVSIICKTDKSAYAETNIDTLLAGSTQFNPDQDIPGPIDVAAAAELTLTLSATGSDGKGADSGTEEDASPADFSPASSPARSRLVVFGDSDFSSNSNFRLSGNRDLILNTFNWLAEAEDLISIRPKDDFTQPVVLSSEQGRVVFWLPVVGLPALVGLVGMLVIVSRRRAG
ncbi:MAG: GldG family protein [Candidatus Krumholzibacteriota bacterium]|nr:GldG family protein [Candidatus Krumholzibacteriota bacterium]